MPESVAGCYVTPQPLRCAQTVGAGCRSDAHEGSTSKPCTSVFGSLTSSERSAYTPLFRPG